MKISKQRYSTFNVFTKKGRQWYENWVNVFSDNVSKGYKLVATKDGESDGWSVYRFSLTDGATLYPSDEHFLSVDGKPRSGFQYLYGEWFDET